MLKYYLATILFLGLAACGVSPNGLLVSPNAEAVGGNLFVETLDDGGQILVLDGEVTPDTSYVFQSLAEYTEIDGLVIAQSPGGDLLASHQIGRTIAANGINTAVLFSCISACVDIFITGRERSIAEDAELGFHSAEDREFGLSVDRPYWRSFGFASVNEAAYKVPFNDIWIVSAERALELRLATEILR